MSSDRFDPEHPIAMRCELCGKLAYGPRKFMAEAIREHQESACAARRTQEQKPTIMRLYYPRS